MTSDKKQGDLESMTREELYEKAKEMDIPGKSAMSKEELLNALKGSESRSSGSHSKQSGNDDKASSSSSRSHSASGQSGRPGSGSKTQENKGTTHHR